MPHDHDEFWVHDEGTSNLSTLGQQTVLLESTKLDGSRTQGTRLLAVRGLIALSGKTSGDGPLIVGFSMGLSITQVKEWVENDPQRKSAAVEMEIASRRAWPVVHFPSGVTTSSTTPSPPDSMYQRYFVPSWNIFESDNLQLFTYNYGGALNTGSIVRWALSFKLRWIID